MACLGQPSPVQLCPAQLSPAQWPGNVDGEHARVTMVGPGHHLRLKINSAQLIEAHFCVKH